MPATSRFGNVLGEDHDLFFCFLFGSFSLHILLFQQPQDAEILPRRDLSFFLRQLPRNCCWTLIRVGLVALLVGESVTTAAAQFRLQVGLG